MSSIHSAVENAFDRLTSVVTRVLGSSITFIIALCVVVYWVSDEEFLGQTTHERILCSKSVLMFYSEAI